jgi:hypothetical protein
MIVGALVALVLVFGAFATFAQTGDDEATATPEAQSDETQSNETESDEAQSDGDSSSQTPDLPGFGWGRHGPGRHAGAVSGQELADALGITLEELQAAVEEARTAAIDQAVADGLLTQEQADELLANGFGGRHWHFGYNQDTFLADALGISVEELQAARLEVYEAQLAEMVAAGVITQEQADLALAQKAVQGYIDTEALQATLQAAYEEAIAQALADGVITQEQADQLLSNQAFGAGGFPGFGGGFGGHHGFGRGGPGGFRWFFPAPDADGASDTSDTSNDA